MCSFMFFELILMVEWKKMRNGKKTDRYFFVTNHDNFQKASPSALADFLVDLRQISTRTAALGCI